VQNKQHVNNFLRRQSWGKRGKILKAHENSLTHLNVKLCSNQNNKGAIKLDKIVDTPITKDKIVACAYAHKRCSN
jgi:hypothetical protein